MYINKIKLLNFRNYEEQEDDPSCGDFTINAESITQSEINDICV